MPPYRANPGGAFNSGLFPAPVARVDVGDAIRALGQSASSLLEATYIRKIADQNRQAREAQAKADRARQADRDRMADEMARENLRLRQETLRLQRERAERDAGAPRAPVRGTPEYEAAMRREEEIRATAPQRAPTPAEAARDEDRRAREAAEEAEGLAWFRANQTNPDVVAAMAIISRTQPALARAPGRAALAVRRALAADVQRENTEARTSASQASAARATGSAPPGVRLVRPGSGVGAPSTGDSASRPVPPLKPNTSRPDRWEELRAAGFSADEATAIVRRELP